MVFTDVSTDKQNFCVLVNETWGTHDHRGSSLAFKQLIMAQTSTGTNRD